LSCICNSSHFTQLTFVTKQVICTVQHLTSKMSESAVLLWVCITSAFGCEQHRMWSINQRFNKHCSCHLQGVCVVWRVLEALYRAGGRWRVGFDGAHTRKPKLHIELHPRKLKDKNSSRFIMSFHFLRSSHMTIPQIPTKSFVHRNRATDFKLCWSLSEIQHRQH
jgi:hypothetical protein